MTILSPPQQTAAFRWVMLALVIAGAATFLPLWAPLVLAAWVAGMTRPLLPRFSKVTHGRRRAAGGLVVLLVMTILGPLGIATASLARGAVDLVRSVLASEGAKSALVAIVSGGHKGEGAEEISLPWSPDKILALLQEHGGQALSLVSGIAGAATSAVLALFVFLFAVYVFLVEGPQQYAWLESHSPLRPTHTGRLVAAFHETGRGLFVGIGLTGLAQGVVATVTYFALGVPRALVLGLLTCVASILPSVGTALVWVPVTAGLAFAGRTVPAAIMAAVGVLVIGTVDNVLRPAFARFGNLELSSFVLLTSIFGGLAIFGPWGFLLGPLFVRLAKEALVIAREDRLPAPITGAPKVD
jgi:predicted PurR-regulated permease PerM